MITVDELKMKLIELFGLEDIEPDEIDAKAPLFNEGLGLDSVDAIELTVFLDNEYGIKFDNMEAAKDTFASIEAMAEFINAHQA